MIYKNMEGCGAVLVMLPPLVLSFKGNFYNVVPINRYKSRDVMYLKNIFILSDNIAKINPIFKECEA